ncbi:MAG: GNAT family N-acetyltransferase [Maribacter sp.]
MSNFLLTGETSARLAYRNVVPSDYSDWLPFHQNPLSNQYWHGLPKDPETGCSAQLKKTFTRYAEGTGGLNALISKEHQKLIGLAGLLIQEIAGVKELEIGYSILPAYWRQGYATEAAEKCKQTAFDNGWATSLISIIHLENIASQRTALNLGMRIDFETTYFGNPVYIFRIEK